MFNQIPQETPEYIAFANIDSKTSCKWVPISFNRFDRKRLNKSPVKAS